MQDVVVYISLETASKEKATLLPLILSFENEFAYKEYNKAEDVKADFPAAASPTYLAASAIFAQAQLENSPGRIQKLAVFGVAPNTQADAVTAALDTLRETYDNWYFLLPTVTDKAMIAALSTWCSGTVLSQAQLEAGETEAEKLLLVQTSDKTAITEALNKNRQTVVCYNHDAANSFIPPAWVGRVSPNYPASVTWKWKELYGVPPTEEGGVDLQDMLEARYNLYISNHSREYMAEGVCTDGEFIDTVIGRWQIKEAMRTSLVNMFVDTENVGYDDEGFTMVAEQILAALDEAVRFGIIMKQGGTGAYRVAIPKRADATEEQARNRIMPPITWEATLRGGVHGVKVTGTLTVAMTTTG